MGIVMKSVWVRSFSGNCELKIKRSEAHQGLAILSIQTKEGVTLWESEPISGKALASVGKDLTYISQQFLLGEEADQASLRAADKVTDENLSAMEKNLSARAGLVVSVQQLVANCPHETCATLMSLMAMVRPNGRFPFAIQSTVLQGGIVPVIGSEGGSRSN